MDKQRRMCYTKCSMLKGVIWVKRWICGILAALMLVAAAPLSFAEPATDDEMQSVPEVAAQSVVLMSLDTGAIIYEKNANERIHPASTTKIMTLIVALENCKDMDASVTVSDTYDDDLVVGSTSINLKEGEQIALTDLLYAVAVSSANDAANVLAEHIGGSVENFISMMNQKAKAIGAKNTHFSNAHGLTAEQHYTTAHDMAKLMEYGLEVDMFRTLLSTYARTIPATNMSGRRVISTTNSLISQVSSNYFKYACGGKTGTTTPAGYNLVSWASKSGENFICVAMHADKESHSSNPIFSDSRDLYNWAFDSFSLQQIINVNDPQTEVPVELSAEKDYVVLTAAEDLSAVLPNNTDLSTLTYELNVPEQVMAPISTGDEIGEVTISKDGVVYGKTKLLAKEDISRSTVLYYLYCIKKFVSNIWVQIIGGILLLLLIIYVIATIRRNRRRRRRRRVRLKPRIRY